MAGSTLNQKFSRHVRDLYPELEQLVEAAEAVETLLGSYGWTCLSALLEAETAEVDRTLDGASEPMSQAQYAMAHGRRGGLRGAEEAARTLIVLATSKLAEARRIQEGAAEPALGR